MDIPYVVQKQPYHAFHSDSGMGGDEVHPLGD